MNRLPALRSMLLVLTTGLSSLTLNAAGGRSGSLRLDGRVLLEEGGAASGASVIVLDAGVELQRITEQLAGFTLDLELGHRYTLVFSQPGRITKELVFDTAVPDGTNARGRYTFRFQVTLEAARPDQQLRYDAPLAIIRFDAAEEDFDYDRTHATPRLVAATNKRVRREVKPFVDPTVQLESWVASKRNEQ
jgi:hypothetical protein